MFTIQLIIENADARRFQDWRMKICKPEIEVETEEFCLCGPRYDSLGIQCLVVALKDNNGWYNIKPFLKDLCESKSIQIVIGKYCYFHRKEEVIKLIEYLGRQARVSDLNHGILLYNEDEIPKSRTIKVKTV